jgi:MSHA pilin protein MshD
MSRGSTSAGKGFTLIELVMSMVVISAGVAGVLSIMSLSVAESADPMLRTQAQAVARAYLEEILLRDFSDPDGVEAGENRATYDDVDDYHGLAANGCLSVSAACPLLGDCVCDQYGVPVASLAGYDVSVSVSPSALNGAAAFRADVTVTHDRVADATVMMTGYRTSY